MTQALIALTASLALFATLATGPARAHPGPETSLSVSAAPSLALPDEIAAGYLDRTLPATPRILVAQEGGAVETSVRPRPRPTGLGLRNLVGQNSAGGQPVEADNSGAILRPQPRADVATSITDRAVADAVAERAAASPVQLTAEPPDAILRPRPRPEGFGQEIRAARAAAEIARVQAENDSTPATRTVSDASVERDRLALDQITLIGVFGTDESRRALLRLPSGEFEPVARGSVIDGWRVLTIDRESVRIGRNSEVLVLVKP